MLERPVQQGAVTSSDSAELGQALTELARFLYRLRGDVNEARRLVEQAVKLLEPADAAAGASNELRSWLHSACWTQAAVLLRHGDHAGVNRAAEAMPRLLPGEWQPLHRAAWYLTRCAELVQDERRADDHARRATAYLGQGVRAGLPGAEQLEKDPAFVRLQRHPEFTELLRQVKRKPRPIEGSR